MNKIFPVLVCCWFVFRGFFPSGSLVAQTSREQANFGSPVEFPIRLSSNYGEIRLDHFHSGIDIKTEGVSGKRILAVEKGYVSRVSISTGGFGKAVYLVHPNGLTTVYAHLSHFSDEIEAYVMRAQYAQKRHQVNLFPSAGQFQVRRGETVGYSGNTGSSMGAHLHFEVRDSRNEHPLNPLLFGFDIADTLKPQISGIFIYPLSPGSHVEYSGEKRWFAVSGNNGQYRLKNGTPVISGGMLGLGIETWDMLNMASNRCGVYSIEVLLDQVSVYFMELDEFSFGETRYLNSHIDYEEKVLNNRNIHQTFVDPNNRLSIYSGLKGRGIFTLTDNEMHEITVILRDAYRNTSHLRFSLHSQWGTQPAVQKPEPAFSRIMPYTTTNIYEHDGFRMVIPENSLYDTLRFSYSRSPALPGTFSEVHHVHNRLTPVHNYFTLHIVPKPFPEGIEKKLLAAIVADDGKLLAAGGEYSDGAVEVRTRDFGKYVIVADTLPPAIIPLREIQGKDLSGTGQIRFRVTDDLSGIRSYNGYIDNQWVLFEYDPKNDLLYYTLDTVRLKRYRDHELVLTVIDNKDNIAVLHARFYW